MCRWAHARMYGLGWNHTQQIIQPVDYARDVCIESVLLKSPAIESWSSLSQDVHTPIQFKALGDVSEQSECPIKRVFRTKIIGDDMIRSVWSSDGTTDMYVEGRPSREYALHLTTPLVDHEPLHVDAQTVWIQDEYSRFSLVLNTAGSHTNDVRSIATATSGVFEIKISASTLPLRIRMVVENRDVFHTGARYHPTYYGSTMTSDVFNQPELFALTKELRKELLDSMSTHTIIHTPDLHKASNRRKKRRIGD
jgi:hypothetical protein